MSSWLPRRPKSPTQQSAWDVDPGLAAKVNRRGGPNLPKLSPQSSLLEAGLTSTLAPNKRRSELPTGQKWILHPGPWPPTWPPQFQVWQQHWKEAPVQKEERTMAAATFRGHFENGDGSFLAEVDPR